MTNAAAELLASKPNVLLDFDGPVCSVFGGVGADNVARQLRGRLGLSEQHSADLRDPFDILRYAATEGDREAVEAERELTSLEVEAVASATSTPGAAELLQTLAQRHQRVVIVSNNSTAAVRAYLDLQGLSSLIYDISARTDSDPTLLKPSPHLLQQAIDRLDTTPQQCVMIGDSLADIEAAQTARIAIVAYANKPGKHDEFASSARDIVIDHLDDLRLHPFTPRPDSR